MLEEKLFIPPLVYPDLDIVYLALPAEVDILLVALIVTVPEVPDALNLPVESDDSVIE
jgi:hypothetical protein